MIATDYTLTAFILAGHFTQLLSTLRDGLAHIFSAVGICSFIWHTHLSIPWKEQCSQSLALPLSYAGTLTKFYQISALL